MRGVVPREFEMAILTTPDRSVRPVLPTGAELPWQAEIRGAIRESDQLCHRLGLSGELSPAGNAGEQQFPVFVPPSYLARIRPGDPTDPLLLQVLPRRRRACPCRGTSPIQSETSPPPSSRGCCKNTGAGPAHRHGKLCGPLPLLLPPPFPLRRHPPRESAWDAAVAAVAADPTITELILSGGDPLMLVDASLARLVAKFQALPQLARLRIHTRLPVMIPRRVTDQLLQLLGNTPLTCVMVLHANHARELADDVAAACDQSATGRRHALEPGWNFLLRDVNDSV